MQAGCCFGWVQYILGSRHFWTLTCHPVSLSALIKGLEKVNKTVTFYCVPTQINMKLVTYIIFRSLRVELAEEALGGRGCATENVPGRMEGSKGLLATSLSPLCWDKKEFPCPLSLPPLKGSSLRPAPPGIRFLPCLLWPRDWHPSHTGHGELEPKLCSELNFSPSASGKYYLIVKYSWALCVKAHLRSV